MAFIAIEGIDGSGKATQTALLAEALRIHDRDCVTVTFPAYKENVFGQLLAELMSGKRGDFSKVDSRLGSLPYSLDRFESSNLVHAALEQGKVVIADRYSGSNQIHQGGKLTDQTERIAYLEWLDITEHGILKNPRPDIVIYLKAPVHLSLQLLAQKRAAKSNEIEDGEMDAVEKDLKYLEDSHTMANWLASYYEHWRVIDCVDKKGAIRSREDINADVLQAVLPLVG